MMRKATSAVVLELMEAQPYNHQIALAECLANGGTIHWAGETDTPPAKGLWRSIKFEDGSSLNLTATSAMALGEGFFRKYGDKQATLTINGPAPHTPTKRPQELQEALLSFDEYQRLASVTMKPDCLNAALSHYALGLVGEVGELVELYGLGDGALCQEAYEKCVGEVGDCCWYLAAILTTLKESLQAMHDREYFSDPSIAQYPPTVRLMVFGARLADQIKKSVNYGKILDIDEAMDSMHGYLRTLQEISSELAMPLQVVMDLNIKKLKARYSDKFDASEAINRDYAKESEAAGIKIA